MFKAHEKSSVLPPDFPSRASLPEFVLPEVLPTDPSALTALLIASVNAKIASDEQIAHLYEHIALAEAAYEKPVWNA